MIESTHNEIRDRIAQEYFSLPSLNCRFCKYETPLVTEGVSQVVAEHGHRQFRADVAALDRQGKVVAVVEVINTNPPSEQVLAAQSELEGAFYVALDALDNGFTGYCSSFCWTNRDEENVSPWSVPTCSACERPYHTLKFTYELLDWENPYYPMCIECAAKTSGGQSRSPGELAMGDPRDRIPGPDADVLDLFLSFSDADFWAMVWATRTARHSEARRSEKSTAVRLDHVEEAFRVGDWNGGERLLQPIGTPGWDRPPGPALFAWAHDNCVRVARAWRRLRGYRLSCLPPTIQAGIGSRPPLPEVLPDLPPLPPVTHIGFSDGWFTACGIDQRESQVEVVRRDATCPRCF